jgi:hypothetical protein
LPGFVTALGPSPVEPLTFTLGVSCVTGSSPVPEVSPEHWFSRDGSFQGSGTASMEPCLERLFSGEAVFGETVFREVMLRQVGL